MVFLSHCKTTKTSLVMPFAQALESIHMPYWFDRKDIVCGGPIYTDIKTGIQQSIYCMAFIDATYLERDWTKRELTLFRHKELTDNPPLFFQSIVESQKKMYTTTSLGLKAELLND